MAFFRNNAVNLLNLHYGIHAVAMYGGGAFFTVYLLKAGVVLASVLVFFALILAGRFLIRPVVVVLATRFGLRRLLIAGTVLAAFQYPLLAEVDGVGLALFALWLTAAVSDTFYWTLYHAYFAVLGDDEHRGHQLGVREAMVAAVGVISPLATAWMLVNAGPRYAFGVAAVVQLSAAVPLIWTPDVRVARQVPGAFKAAAIGVALFFADGWIASGFIVLWQLALFLTLGENFINYGGALAIAAVAGAVSSLVLGRNIDVGHGTKMLWLTFAAFALAISLRAAAPGNAALAIFANAFGAFVISLYTTMLMAAVYNFAKRSPCPLRFHVATEGGWDAGGASGCLLMALLIYLQVPLSVAIGVALTGAVASLALLSRYYGAAKPENAPAISP